MLVPLAWLRDYLELPSADAVADALAGLGFPVDAVIERPKLTHVVVGKIAAIEKHPNADRLQVCTIDVGAEKTLTIATAATNVAADQIVPVALIGSELAGGLKIAPRKMRGIDSEGMLCSASELGLEGDWFEDGILQLDVGMPLGADVVRMFRLDEPILDVEVTSNRVDAMSMLGLARELGARFEKPVREPDTTVAYGSERVSAEGKIVEHDWDSYDVKIVLESPDARRFVAQRVSSIRVRRAKAWMRIRLALAGQRPINNVVDISNFVMLETGQPLHFYDFDKLADHTIVVRDAQPGEAITTLDDVERTLDPRDLIIADTQRPQGIAGIKGGLYSEVTDATRELVIEAANFTGSRIRRSALAHNLRSEASSRHEKRLPLALCDFAAARAARLLEQEGATIHMPRSIGEPVAMPELIALRSSAIARTLGFTLPDPDVHRILSSLGFDVKRVSDGHFELRPPHLRSDIATEIDAIEELARIAGYDRIDGVLPQIVPQAIDDRPYRLERELTHTLAGLGYHEILSLALQPEALQHKLERAGLTLPFGVAEIRNPLSEDQRYLRFSLLPSALDAVVVNAHRAQTQPLRLFEVGHYFRSRGDAIEESDGLLIVLAQPKGDEPAWRDSGFQTFKSDLLALVRHLTGREPAVAPASPLGFHPGRAATLSVAGTEVAAFGAVDPRLLAAWEISLAMYAAFFPSVSALPPYVVPTFRAPSRFPAVTRDLALVVDPEVTAAQLEATAAASGDGVVREVRSFDEYRGAQIGSGKKSLALHVVLQRDDATMTDDEADAAIGAMVKALGERHGAVLRGG